MSSETPKCECGHAIHDAPCAARHIKMQFLSGGAVAETITTCGCTRRPALPESLSDTSKVTRFEVIDHRANASPNGRVFSAHDCVIELSKQDGGRTLKVFVNDPTPSTGGRTDA